jgi:hypothetical protein
MDSCNIHNSIHNICRMRNAECLMHCALSIPPYASAIPPFFITFAA